MLRTRILASDYINICSDSQAKIGSRQKYVCTSKSFWRNPATGYSSLWLSRNHVFTDILLSSCFTLEHNSLCSLKNVKKTCWCEDTYARVGSECNSPPAQTAGLSAAHLRNDWTGRAIKVRGVDTILRFKDPSISLEQEKRGISGKASIFTVRVFPQNTGQISKNWNTNHPLKVFRQSHWLSLQLFFLFFFSHGQARSRS